MLVAETAESRVLPDGRTVWVDTRDGHTVGRVGIYRSAICYTTSDEIGTVGDERSQGLPVCHESVWSPGVLVAAGQEPALGGLDRDRRRSGRVGQPAGRQA